MKIALSSTLLACAALAACMETPASGVPEEDQCGASALQGLVGKPGTVLETMRFDKPLRVLRPGMAVTMDYSAERLNIELNDANVISRVSCG